MKKQNILITGGAGFIGSNLIAALIELEHVGKVRVLDNLATGFRRNLEPWLGHQKFEFMEGDIRDYETCEEACAGIDLISHQAALGSVPRSIKDPLTTNAVNITGFINMLQAAVKKGIKRFVFAASSSTYGDSQGLPKVENVIGNPLSPYAVTKYVNELYADVFARTYGIECIGMRYFNVFGPLQDPNGAYAAVIPLFFKAALQEEAPVINGDGSYSRDFTYIDNALEANLLSLFTPTSTIRANAQKSGYSLKEGYLAEIFNIACGQRTTLLELWELIRDATGATVQPIFGPERSGDIPHSLADISKARAILGYTGKVSIKEGIEKTLPFAQSVSS